MIKFQVCRRHEVDEITALLDGKIEPLKPGAAAGAAAPAAGDPPPGTAAPAAAAPAVPAVPAAAATTATTATTEFNETEYFKKTFGDKFDAADKVKNVLTRAEQLELENTTLKTADPLSFIKDPYIKGLVKATNDGVPKEAYDRVASVDTEKLSEKDAMVTMLMWKKGHTKEDAEFLVNEKYKLDPTLNIEDPAVRLARLDFKTDAADAKKFITDFKAQSLTPPAVAADTKMEEQHAVLAPVVAQLADNLKVFKLDDNDANPFTVPDDVSREASDFVLDAIRADGVEIDMSNKAQLAEIAKEIRFRMFEKVGFDKVIRHYVSAITNADLSKNHNSSLLNGQDPKGGQKKADAEKEVAHIYSQIDKLG